jgi:putative membrane protein
VNLPRWLKWMESQNIKILALCYGVGLVLHLVPDTRPLMLSITPFAILFTGFYVLGGLAPWKQPRLAVFLVFTFVFTFSVEAAGVATGLVFGSYRYGETLGPKLLGVPLVIGLVWCLVVTGAIFLSLRLSKRRAVALFLVPLLCVAFDIVLERGAVFLGYWTWGGAGGLADPVPLHNYAAWAAVSYLLTAAFLWLRIDCGSRLPAANVVIQFAFFSGILIWTLCTGETNVYLF